MLKNLIQFGNGKLPKSTMIFNLGAASDCASAKKGLCNVIKDNDGNVNMWKCYAYRPESFRPQVLPYRRRQRDYWLKNEAAAIAFDIAELWQKKRNKPTHLRFNESGDFYSQKCVDKAEAIAKKLYKAIGLKCYVYTARKDLDFSGCKYLVVNGSGFKKEGITRMFTAVKDPSKFEGFVCPQNCNICNKCSIKDTENIVVAEH